MTRIAPIEDAEQTFKDRSTYTARLYGLPKNTNTIILTQSIKHLKPKTCFVPKCSISGKERSFAIISFQMKAELNKACSSQARYLHHKLTWSKTRIYSTSPFQTSTTDESDNSTNNHYRKSNSSPSISSPFTNPESISNSSYNISGNSLYTPNNNRKNINNNSHKKKTTIFKMKDSTTTLQTNLST